MFVHHIAYQHQNGDIEEFAGSGLTPAAARQNGVYCALSAVRTGRGERFDQARIVVDPASAPASHRSLVNAKIPSLAYLAALL
jgi:hypothetical protein